MKKVSTQFKNVITAAFGLLLAFCVAVFACYAWFTSSKQVNSSGISANVDEAFITDFSCTPYSLIFVSEDTSENKKTYTVDDVYDADSEDPDSYSINNYDYKTKPATLMVISYTVKDSSDTMLTFSCDGSDNTTAVGSSNVAVSKESDGKDYVKTVLSNGVSLRLLDDSSITNVSKGNTVSSTKNIIPFCYEDSGLYYKQQVFFNNVTATNNTVTLYFLVEYIDENISNLYEWCTGSNLSMGLKFTQDITLSITHADDTLDPSGGTGTAAINDSGLSSVSYNLNSANQKSAANLITSTSKTTIAKTTIAKTLAAKTAAEDSSQNTQSTEIVSGAIRTTTYSMSYVADSAGGSTTDSSDNFKTTYTSTNEDVDSNVTFSNNTDTLKTGRGKYTEDGSIYYENAYNIVSNKTKSYITIEVSSLAKNTTITVYASHIDKGQTYTLVVSSRLAYSTSSQVAEEEISPESSSYTPQYLHAINANLNSDTTYYIYAYNADPTGETTVTIQVYAVVVSYSTVETIIY